MMLNPRASRTNHCALAVVVATGEEGAPLVASLGNPCELSVPCGRVVIGEWARCRGAVVETGVGARRVRPAMEALLERLSVERLLLAGVCGGVAPELPATRTLFPRRVQDPRGDFWLERDGPAWAWAEKALHRLTDGALAQGILVAAEGLLGRDAKERLRENDPGVQGVDMEALEFARVAAGRGIAWAVLKTVTDPWDFDLPSEPRLAERMPRFREVFQNAIRENARLVEGVLSVYPSGRAEGRRP